MDPKTGGRARLWRRAVVAVLVTLVAASGLAVLAPPTSASIFTTTLKWAEDPVTGHAIVPVCIMDESSTIESRDVGVHDPNPSLDTVVGRVRDHVRRNWERYSNARFVGWEMCSEIPSADLGTTVEIYIHPDAPNGAILGAEAAYKKPSKPSAKGEANFKPWGLFHKCIVFDGFKHQYKFDCAEQYGTHELGHVLGFGHEWLHPLTPEECAETRDAEEQPGEPGFTVYNTEFYDWNSIMTYDDECADVTGARFGSPNLSLWDQIGAGIAYPIKPDHQGEDTVGVIPDEAGACPDTTEVVVQLDNEDDGGGNSTAGYIGAFRSDRNTRMVFCKVRPDGFRRAAGTDASASYAVLKLGNECPDGSVLLIRTHDDENTRNESWMAGETGPLQQNFDLTQLHWCLFPPSGSSTGMTRFPEQPFEYGVLGVEGPEWVRDDGFVFLDDENGPPVNKNSIFLDEVTPTTTAAMRTVIPENTTNTTYKIAAVRQNQPPMLTAPVTLVADEGVPLALLASVSDPDGDAVSVTWSIDDEVIGTGAAIAHVFDDDGFPEVTVTATDANGASVSEVVFVEVQNVAPLAFLRSFSESIDEGDEATISFLVDDQGDDTITATIDWGDGSAPSEFTQARGTLVSAAHTYVDDPAGGGDYTVAVRVADEDGGTRPPIALPLEVRNVAPSVEVEATSVDEGETMTVDVTVTDPGLDEHTIGFTWPDGEPAERTVAADPGRERTYTERFERVIRDDAAGSDDAFEVQVDVADGDGGTGSAVADVVVSNVAPTVSVEPHEVALPEGSVATLRLVVDDQGPDDVIEGYVDWGDGIVDVLSADLRGEHFIEHRFVDDGTYRPEVTVIDDDGGMATDSVQVIAANVAPTATVTRLRQPAEVDIGDLGDSDVVFTDVPLNIGATVTDPGVLDVLSYRIDWGDGSWRTGAVDGGIDTSRAYQEPGDRTITLTVSDDDGDSSMVTRSVRVVDPAGGLEDAVGDLEALLAGGGLAPAAASEVQAAIDDLAGTGSGPFAQGAITRLGAGDFVGGANRIVAATEHLVAAGPELHHTAMQLAVATRSLAVDRLQASRASAATIAKAKQSIGQGTNQLRAQLPLGAAKRYRDAVRTLESPLGF